MDAQKRSVQGIVHERLRFVYRSLMGFLTELLFQKDLKTYSLHAAPRVSRQLPPQVVGCHAR